MASNGIVHAYRFIDTIECVYSQRDDYERLSRYVLLHTRAVNIPARLPRSSLLYYGDKVVCVR